MKYTTFHHYLEEQKENILQNCNACAKCIRICPNAKAFDLTGDQIKELPRKLLDVVAGGEITQEVFQWVFGCTQCGICVPVCPQGIDMMTFRTLLRREMLRQKHRHVVMLRDMLSSPQHGFQRSFDILEKLFVNPDQRKWLTGVPETVSPVETVVFIGCTGLIRPDVAFSLLDIMDMLGEDYVALGSAQLCCGNPFKMAGDIDAFETHLRNLFETLTAFSPTRVLYACAECLRNGLSAAQKIVDIPFEQQSAVTFIADNIKRLPFKNVCREKVTFHDPCSLGRHCGDFDSPRTILRRIPGADFEEMENVKEESPCCGAASETFFPGKNEPMRQKRLQDFKNSGAQRLVTACVGCESTYQKWKNHDEMETVNLFPFILEHLGMTRQNPLKPYYPTKDVDAVIENYRGNIPAGPYTEDEYRAVVAKFLGVAKKK